MMKVVFGAMAVMLWAGGGLADPVEGTWKTQGDDTGKYGYIQIKPCGDKFCGILVKGFDANGVEGPSENIGTRIIWDMVAAGGGSYTDGTIWAPDRDKTYSSKMQLSGDTLSVSGCVLGGVICRGQDWTRVK